MQQTDQEQARRDTHSDMEIACPPDCRPDRPQPPPARAGADMSGLTVVKPSFTGTLQQALAAWTS
jgi:hypothetical protein